MINKLQSLYKLLISPWLGNRCRYAPSCSEYAKQAFAQHGALKGAYFTTHRLCRCQPFGGSGYDPVPEAKTGNKKLNQSAQHNCNLSEL